MTFAQAQRAIVVDASAAVRFLLGEAAWLEHWKVWTETGALVIVPGHFPAEVANALLRSARLTAADTTTRLERLSAARLETADRGWAGILGAVELAERHRLTIYDALYLDLALDVDAELATLDRSLATAARSEGLAITA